MQSTVSMTGDGGAEGDRTPDLRIANAALSQLSYSPDIGASVSNKGEVLQQHRRRGGFKVEM